MGSYSVERSITVKAPASRVHALVDNFRGWTSWSPWEDLDPDLERTYSGPEQGIGAHYAWSGNKKAGAGSMEITRSSAEEIVIALAFLKPFKSTSTTLFRFARRGEAETEVTWQMTGEQRGMMAVFGKVMKMDKLIGPDFEKGLGRLKAAAER
jgi:Polyketide cyclase / dehydrase and lipid transport